MTNKMRARSYLKSDPANSIRVQKMAVFGENNEMASILFTIPNNGIKNEDELAKVVTATFGGRASLCEETVTRVPNATGLFRGFLRQNRESKSAEVASSEQGWHSVSATLFSDPEDNLWELSGTVGNQMLVRVAEEDMSDILSAKQSRTLDTASVGVMIEQTPGINSAVLFFNEDTASLDLGIYTGNKQAFVYNAEVSGLVRCEPASVVFTVERHAIPTMPKIEEASRSDVIAYYKALYGDKVEFFSELKSAIIDRIA